MNKHRDFEISLKVFEIRLAVAVVSISTYLWVRPRLGAPSAWSVILELSGLIVLSVAIARVSQVNSPSKVLSQVVVGVVIALSIAHRTIHDRIPSYWTGFGWQVLALALTLTSLAVVCGKIESGRHIDATKRNRLPTHRTLAPWFAGFVILWTLPSVIQPMDAWLKVGDSTEKVLDEIAGWVTGNIPGVDTSWVHGSLLGAPLFPLGFLNGRGDWKIVIVVLYVNFLVLLMPLILARIICQSVPKVGFPAALAVSMTSLVVSGPRLPITSGSYWVPANTSLFQELSFLSRGLLPLAIGCLIGSKWFAKKSSSQSVVLGALCAAATFNNIEYGAPAAAAGLLVLITPSPSIRIARVKILQWVGAFLILSVCLTFPGLTRGGDWVGRRVGAFLDVMTGNSTAHSNNAGSSIPYFGLPTIVIALAVLGAGLFWGAVRFQATTRTQSGSALRISGFFSLWTLLSAPYFLNGGGQGGARTQFLMVPLVAMVAGMLGLFSLGERTSRDPSQVQLRPRRSRISEIPLSLILISSLLVASILNSPNGLYEWRRLQSPSGLRVLDEWSPSRLHNIDPSAYLKMARKFDTESKVGWWYSFGNGVQILTDIENLLGVSGYETMRTARQLRLGCEPLLRFDKKIVFASATENVTLLDCEGISADMISPPDENGIAVYVIRPDTP